VLLLGARSAEHTWNARRRRLVLRRAEAFIERFNRTYRTEILDAYVFASLTEVREVTSGWLDRYNTKRPHDSLGHVPPLTYRPRPTTLPESISKL
jgi:putative transposase